MSALRCSFLVITIVSLVACGSDVKGGGSGGNGGASSNGSGGAGAGGSGGSGGGSIQCTGTTAVFPTFDKTCSAAADCVIKFHMVNCCGTRVSIGMNKAESVAFDAAEATCEMQYPGCGCAQGPTQAEDGKTGAETDIQVDCLSGACMTFLP